eukprot:gene15474-21559_t
MLAGPHTQGAQHNDTAGYISTVFITSLQLMKGVKSLADATRVLFWLFGLDLVSARPKDHSLDDSPLLSPSHAQRAGLLSFEMACNLHSNGDTFQQLEAMRGHPAPPPGFECLRADMAVKLAIGGTGSPRHLLRNSSGGGSIPDQPPRHNSVSASLHSHPQHTTTAAAVLLSVAAAQQGLSPAGGSGAKQPPIPRQPAKLEPEGEEGKKERNRKGRHRNAEKAAGISNDTTTTTTDKISNKNNNSNNNNRMSRASNDGVGGGKAIHTSHAGSGGGGGGGGGRDKRVSRDGGSKKCDQ